MPRYQPNRLSADPTKDFDFIYRHPLPNPLNRLSFREVARDTGYAPSTCHRFLNDPQRLTRQHIAKLMGTYGLDFDQLLDIVILVPPNPIRQVTASTLAASGRKSHSADTTPDDDNDSPYGLHQPARHRNGRPVVPLALDEQRTPPPNLDPNELYLPQTPADKRAGRPPVKRKMTEEEFCSYDPEPKDEKSEAFHWWFFRLRTRPSLDLPPESWAPERASAEFGNHNPREGASRRERAEEILAALKANQPIPPFDLTDPRWGIDFTPPEPRRRGKGKKNKDKNKEQ